MTTPTGSNQHIVNQVFTARTNRDIDILFMIDDSPSMLALQVKLAGSFGTFATALSTMPGGPPNLHLAVVSSDMGAGRTSITAACQVGGDGGQFRFKPSSACATGLAPGQTFLSVIDGHANFTGDLAQAFSCIAQLGDEGCGYEHQFASMLKALEPAGLPASNDNFLRPSAYLAIVLVTNEDDCSAPPDSNLFDPSSRLVSDPLGPLSSFRCNEYGHLCDGKKPPRAPATLMNCTSAEDGTLLKVSEVIQRTKALKGGDASKILVSAIAANTTPYQIVANPNTTINGVTENEPAIVHSCTVAGDGTFGDPAIRIKMWVDAFKGVFVSICDDTFAPALTEIAGAVAQAMGPSCLDGNLVDTDESSPDLEPNCVFTGVTIDAQGNKTRTPIPSCDKSEPAPLCWAISSDQSACSKPPGVAKTQFQIRSSRPLNLEQIETSCAVCNAGATGKGCHRY